jgi:hypothetical protein
MSTAETITLYSPRAERYLDASEQNDRRWDGSLAAKRVALVDNGRPNADKVLELLERELVEQYGIEPTWIRKVDHGRPGMGGWTVIPILDVAPNLADEVDLVITGIGNCGGCTLRSVLDVAELESRGVPAVVLVEPSWYEQAKIIGKSVSLPPSRIRVLPLGQITANSADALPLIEENLAEILDGIVEGLGDAAVPAGAAA